MKLTELNKRILTALIMLPIVIFMILYSQKLFIFLLLVVLILTCYEWFNLNKNDFSIATILGFLTILLSVISAFVLRGLSEEDSIFFLWIIFVCFFSDIGGFFFGKAFGKKKITEISPNKTYAGLCGSFIFSTFPILLFYFLSIKFPKFDIINLSWKILILSLLFSFFCQLGDITVSYFKRKKKVKDTGNLLPGHGGLLDRIDGVIFVLIFSGILKFFQVI